MLEKKQSHTPNYLGNIFKGTVHPKKKLKQNIHLLLDACLLLHIMEVEGTQLAVLKAQNGLL